MATVSVRYVGPHTEGVEVPISATRAMFFPHGEWVDAPDEIVHGKEQVVKVGDDLIVHIIEPGTTGLLAQNESGTVLWELAETKRGKRGDAPE